MTERYVLPSLEQGASPSSSESSCAQPFEAMLAHEREITARLQRELQHERLRADLLQADQADLIDKLREIRRLQVVVEGLQAENLEYRDLVGGTLALKGRKDGALEALRSLFVSLSEAQTREEQMRAERAIERARHAENNAEALKRVNELAEELSRVQKLREDNYVPRLIYEEVADRLQKLSVEVEELRQHRMEAIPMLREREAILNSTAWRFTALPRKLLTLIRQKRHASTN